MAEYFKMPTLGQSMEEGTVLQWFKREGEAIRRGEALLEVMSDKANFEVEAPVDGVLRKILVPENGTVPVNTPLAIIGTADEPIEALLQGVGQGEATIAQTATGPVGPSVSAAVVSPMPAPQLEPASVRRVSISPRARRLADERGIPIAALAGIGTGPEGRVLERDVLAYLERLAVAPADSSSTGPEVRTERPKPRVTPLAARMAGELGVNIEELAMGLPGSRVTAEVVRRTVEAGKPAPRSATEQTKGGAPAVAEVIPLRGLRKMVADNVTFSRQTAPHVTLVTEADVTEMVALFERLRPEIQRRYDTKLTYTDLLVKAVARALCDHPLCNAALVENEIQVYADKNIGVAVATENGLLVPVIHQADTLSLAEISRRLRELAERCRTGKQTPDDLMGGTFTLTNLGAFGIDAFDPIIVPPQSCILGIGRIMQKPIVVEGQVAIRSMMSLCLSFDHRVLDGVPAAKFLQTLTSFLGSPLLILV
jgi:pyruvate dehydrogenase E2 component (dihydrolipoamide acetyltransferase)